MHRPQFGPGLPAMPSHSEYAMTERPRHSYSEVPSVSYLQPQSRSLGYEYRSQDYTERPNLVVSGSRKFSRGFFTGPRGNFDSHADRIVQKLEENKELMDDTPLSEQLRKEALRDLPQCLTMKRCVKHKLTKSVSQKSKHRPISFWKRFKYQTNINFSKFVGSMKNFNYFELWHGRLKDIEGHFGSGYASYFKFLRFLFVMNFFIALISFVFLVLPQVIYHTSSSDANTQTFDVKDIFTGTGYLFDTVLYYGHYTNETIDVIPHIFFDMSAAYFSITVILYLISFVVLAISVAQSYRRNFIETEGGLRNVYANRIFCGWDYGIANKEAAELKSSSIYHELKELLSEDLTDDVELSCLLKFWTYTIQVVVHIFVIVILAAVGWLTWELLEKAPNDTPVVTAIVTNVIIMIFPTIFNYISRYEDYKNPRTPLYMTLARTYLLGGVIIGVVLAFWLKKASSNNCWENELASEIYRFIIYDFFFSVAGSFLIDAGYFVGRYFFNRNPKSDFNVAKNTLQIIYNQCLFWVGFFYSPILPIIVTIKMFIIWYVTEFSVRKFCRPPKRTWRAAQTQTWFMMMTFIGILLIIAVHGYTMNSVPSSSICGPFKNYNYTYEIVTSNVVANLDQDPFGRVVMSITRPGGVAFIMIALIILVYYLREQAFATREKVKILKETLVWMAKDKKYLVQLYNDLANKDSNQHFRDYRFMEPARVSTQDFVDSSSSVSEDEFNARFKKYS